MATLVSWEVSRNSLQMVLTSTSALLSSFKPGPTAMLIKYVDSKLSDFLKTCPESFFKITIEGKSEPSKDI